MSFRIAIPYLLFGLILLGTERVGAEVLFHEQFSHPDGSILKTPGPGNPGLAPNPGPGSNWSSAGGSLIPIQVLGGEAILIQTENGDNGQDGLAPFTPQATTATTYARFDFRLPSDGNTLNQEVIDEGAIFVALRSSAASGLRARTGLTGPASDGDFRLALNTDDNDLVGTGVIWEGDLDFDVTYRAIISYNAANAMSQLWLNPTVESSPSIVDASEALALSIENFYLRQADDYIGKLFIDNLVVATSFAEALSGGGGGNFLEADFNEDGAVDGLDLLEWQESYSIDADGDADDDGDSDGRDFLVWQRLFGQMPEGLAATSVPEPNSLTLFAFCALLTALNRRNVRKFAAEN